MSDFAFSVLVFGFPKWFLNTFLQFEIFSEAFFFVGALQRKIRCQNFSSLSMSNY